MEMVPVESIPDEGKLVEITDSKVLVHVNNLVPGLCQAGVDGNKAVRGFYYGADGIQGHANLVAVEAQKGTAVLANTALTAIGVASLVVRQYYKTQINSELRKINDGISKISYFQDNEFRSRIFSIVVRIKKIADFQVEILDNEELRLPKIAQLDSLEE